MSDMIGGFYPKPKNPNAPDYVICKGSINVAQFREWMQAHLKANPDEEWINFDFLVSKAGKGYAKIDTWKPDGAPKKQVESEDIPF